MPAYAEITTGFDDGFNQLVTGDMWPPHIWKYVYHACGQFNCGVDKTNNGDGISGSIVELRVLNAQTRYASPTLYLKLWFDGRYNGIEERDRLIANAFATQGKQMGAYIDAVMLERDECKLNDGLTDINLLLGYPSVYATWSTPSNFWVRDSVTKAWLDMKVLEFQWDAKFTDGFVCGGKLHGDKYSSPAVQEWHENLARPGGGAVTKVRSSSRASPAPTASTPGTATLPPQLLQSMPADVVQLFTTHGPAATQEDVKEAAKQGYAVFGSREAACRMAYNDQGKPICT